MQSERDRVVLLKHAQVILTRVEVLKNWQDKPQRNVASRSPEAPRSIHRNVQQLQRRVQLEREQSKKAVDKLKDMVCRLTKREDHYKVSLDNLERENKELRRDLADMRRERGQAELANNAKVSELRDEIELSRVQIAQLRNEHKQQLILQDTQHKNEISKYERLSKDTTAKSFQGQNIVRRGKIGITEKHPALIDEQKTKKLPGLEVRKVTISKRRKLFQDDNDIAVDII